MLAASCHAESKGNEQQHERPKGKGRFYAWLRSLSERTECCQRIAMLKAKAMSGNNPTERKRTNYQQTIIWSRKDGMLPTNSHAESKGYEWQQSDRRRKPLKTLPKTPLYSTITPLYSCCCYISCCCIYSFVPARSPEPRRGRYEVPRAREQKKETHRMDEPATTGYAGSQGIDDGIM